MAGGGGRLDEKDENDRGKYGTKRKYGIGGIRRNRERRVEEWLEREIGVKVKITKEVKINKNTMMLAKIESWEQKNIMLSKSKLREKRR
jgi:hypothetical protein